MGVKKRFPDYGDELDEQFLWYEYDDLEESPDGQTRNEQGDYRYDEEFDNDGFEWEE